jgi:hypothetical protein
MSDVILGHLKCSSSSGSKYISTDLSIYLYYEVVTAQAAFMSILVLKTTKNFHFWQRGQAGNLTPPLSPCQRSAVQDGGVALLYSELRRPAYALGTARAR